MNTSNKQSDWWRTTQKYVGILGTAQTAARLTWSFGTGSCVVLSAWFVNAPVQWPYVIAAAVVAASYALTAVDRFMDIRHRRPLIGCPNLRMKWFEAGAELWIPITNGSELPGWNLRTVIGACPNQRPEQFEVLQTYDTHGIFGIREDSAELYALWNSTTAFWCVIRMHYFQNEWDTTGYIFERYFACNPGAASGALLAREWVDKLRDYQEIKLKKAMACLDSGVPYND